MYLICFGFTCNPPILCSLLFPQLASVRTHIHSESDSTKALPVRNMSSSHSNAQSTRQHTSSRKRAPSKPTLPGRENPCLYQDKTMLTDCSMVTEACISCRSRKVRCDVFFGGTPCTNCSLDGLGCVVVGRAFRLLVPPLIMMSWSLIKHYSQPPFG